MAETDLETVVRGVLAEIPEWDSISTLGVELYLVGGSVRDALLDKTVPNDLDLVTTVSVGDIATQIADQLGVKASLFEAFDTATISTHRLTIDLARTRRESYPTPGALPVVESVTSIEEDLQRRDFTVNTFALRLDENGPLLSVSEAADDLKNRQLRVLHDQSFIDDPTRIFRLCRYAARLDFTPEFATEELLREAVKTGALSTLSKSRVGAELLLLAREPTALEAIGWLERFDVITELGLSFDQEVATTALEITSTSDRRDLVLLSTMMDNYAGVAELLDQFGFTAGDRDLIVNATAQRSQLRTALDAAKCSSEILGAVGSAPREAVAVAGGSNAKLWLDSLSAVKLEISGDDLLAAGVEQGPKIGEALQRTLEKKLDGEISDRDQELASALSYINGSDDE